MKRFVSEIVELTRNCEIGQADERAVVTHIDGASMALVFVNRPWGMRNVNTGVDYAYLRTV